MGAPGTLLLEFIVALAGRGGRNDAVEFIVWMATVFIFRVVP
jgi:hypothetical protein